MYSVYLRVFSLAELTGHEIQSFILWNFEYGKNYSGPG